MDAQKNLEDAAFEAVVKLEKARAALTVTIDRFNLDNIELTKSERDDLANCAQEVYFMLEVIDDYMFDIYNNFEKVL